ncbi:MAG: radical SAM protein [Desulfobacterales bacterium]|nr:radical SAM protein [Desulfobacterales bacterium]
MERKPHFRSDGVLHATINGHRLHLRRKDPIRDNFLWIDGQQPPLVLDETAAEFVEHLIDAMWLYQQGDGDKSQPVIDYIVKEMTEKYVRKFSLGKNRVTKEKISRDLHRIFGTLMSLAEGACPVEIGLASKEITYGKWIAPARMDLAVTYRCNLSCQKCYVGDRKITRELTTEEWFKVYEILWKLGVPQIVFTGGEPTLREDIVKLISEADEFVTGLVTNGTKLLELAEAFKNASLDYAQVTIESWDPRIHDQITYTEGSHAQTVAGIKKALAVGLQIVTNTTLTKVNVVSFPETIKWLGGLGVKNISCNTLICSGNGIRHKKENGLTDDELKKTLLEACEIAGKLGVNLQWYSPTCYNQGVNPVELGFGIKACSAAAHNMTIEPDGAVLPCQSWPDSVGNILLDDWASIWRHPTCLKLRDHLFMPKECQACGYEKICGGGCPLDQSPRTKIQREKEAGK